MAIYTAGELINRALRLLGVLAEGETPTASESADGVTALAQMLDSWNTESLSVHTTLDTTVVWPAGQATSQQGLPVPVLDSSYFVVNGISYPLQLINELQYNAIPNKATTSTFPLYAFISPVDAGVVGADGVVDVSLYPVPTQNITIHFITYSEIAVTPVSTASNLALPPGYVRAFVYNLAMELAPEWGVEPSRQVQRIAMTSKRNIKRINSPDDVLGMPIGPLTGGGFNIYNGA